MLAGAERETPKNAQSTLTLPRQNSGRVLHRFHKVTEEPHQLCILSAASAERSLLVVRYANGGEKAKRVRKQVPSAAAEAGLFSPPRLLPGKPAFQNPAFTQLSYSVWMPLSAILHSYLFDFAAGTGQLHRKTLDVVVIS